MPRIAPVQTANADPAQAEILGAVQKKLGMVPNIVATLATAPAAVAGYLGFSQALSSGLLTTRLREQIALVVSETNGCGYCLAAHTAIGKSVGLDAEATLAARRARAADPKDEAALEFARAIVVERGQLTDDDLKRVRAAGHSDAEIVEILANVALNLFTNYFNHVAETETDFPEPPKLSAA